jgi:hypothetical protein
VSISLSCQCELQLMNSTGLAKVGPDEQVVAVFQAASELCLPICQAMIEHIFSSSTTLGAHAADALSVALLNAVRTAVERDQSQGLELLTTLESTVTDKVRSCYPRFAETVINTFRYEPMLNARSSTHLVSSSTVRRSTLAAMAMAMPLQH